MSPEGVLSVPLSTVSSGRYRRIQYGAILKTRSDDKIEYLAQILKGAVVDSVRGDYSAEEYLYLASDLTIQELTVAGHLCKARPQHEDRAWEAWRKDVSTEVGLEVPLLR